MKWTKGRLADKETIEYFIPKDLKSLEITEEDWENFFAKSERGKDPEVVTRGYEAINEGKRWRGIHMEMYEEGLLDPIGGVGCYSILGGDDGDPMPRSVVDFMKREMFKGVDSELIEEVYKYIVNGRD